MVDVSDYPPKPKSVWSLGSYSDLALFILPVSAHLVRMCRVSPNDTVLDVACGTGNTAITARRMGGAKVTGVDFTAELLSQAKAEAALAEADGIVWKEGDAEELPFGDESFDVVLSSFGHMFAQNPEAAIREMLRVLKRGGRVAFATWPSELVNGKLSEVMARHLTPTPPEPNSPPPYSPMQWGNPDVVKKRLGPYVKDIHFERGVVNIPMLSPNHYWRMASTKSGPLIHAIQSLNDAQKVESLKKDVLRAIAPYSNDNMLRLDYLVAVAIKE